jgi:hypothetical protein
MMEQASMKFIRKRESPKHAYRFRINDKIVPQWATVKKGKHDIDLVLTLEHAQRAIKLNGHGDGQNCAGAICVLSHGRSFPHPFTGHVDFHKRRIYVSTKNNKMNLPVECVVYRHDSKVAHLFDNKLGLKKLISVLKDGPIIIHLKHVPKEWPAYKSNPERPSGKGGEHKKYVGHRLRVHDVLNGGLDIGSLRQNNRRVPA